MTNDMPADMDAQLEKIAALVRVDPVYGPLLPDLVATVRELLAQLGRAPVTVAVADPAVPGKKVSVTLGPVDFQLLFSSPRFLRGYVRNLQKLPAAVLEMSRGDWTPLALAALEQRRAPGPNAMVRVVRNASGIGPTRRALFRTQAERSLFGDYHEFPDLDDAPAWRGPDLGDAWRENLRRDFPVLILNGDIDALTVARNATETAAGFPRGHFVLLKNFAHATIHSVLEENSAFLDSPALKQLCDDYLRGKKISPPAELTLPPLKFAPPKK